MSSLAPGVQVKIESSGSTPITGVGTSTAAFLLTGDAPPPVKTELFTSYDAFHRKYLVGPDVTRKAALAAATVHGFFLNGGTRCYVSFYKDQPGFTAAWTRIKKLDEVALVAAPGCDATSAKTLVDDCEALGDRFVILDGPSAKTKAFREHGAAGTDHELPTASDYAAYYYPWLVLPDPAGGKEPLLVPPSGHVAGVYARVDATRGVHKAPANEAIRGALGLADAVTAQRQAAMNALGVNAIRTMQGSVRIWGARTLGGDANGETRHVNIRRTLIYLRESIDAGMQWAVFEPNTPALWAKIRRNVGAFLHDVWASGALFGNTAEEAYYVACNEELNPPSMRDNGQLNVEIGVALVKPAEFITINIRQWSGPTK